MDREHPRASERVRVVLRPLEDRVEVVAGRLVRQVARCPERQQVLREPEELLRVDHGAVVGESAAQAFADHEVVVATSES